MATAWSLLSLADVDRQFAGNSGYDDSWGAYYSFDATVPNHLRVRAGDLAVLRDGKHFLGSAWIDGIESWIDSKPRLRCPKCASTGFKQRTTMLPVFRCSCGATFDEPTVETVSDLAFFRAHFAETWEPVSKRISAHEHEALYIRRAQQHAIRELELSRVLALLRRALP